MEEGWLGRVEARSEKRRLVGGGREGVMAHLKDGRVGDWLGCAGRLNLWQCHRYENKVESVFNTLP